MLRDTLKLTVEAAVAALVREGKVPAAVAEVPVEISDTKSPEHGDYACNLAMVAAKKAGMNPRALGETLREALLQGTGDRGLESASDGAINGIQPPTGDNAVGRGVAAFGQNLPNRDVLESVEVAGPGFLNLRLKPESIAAYVPQVVAAGESYGHLKQAAPQRINVEFVSVNPNGPITIGSGRGAAFGSALANVLQAAGNVVHREYYINDGVNSEQMRQFAVSVRASIYDLLQIPRAAEDMLYRGEYVARAARSVAVKVLPTELINLAKEAWIRSHTQGRDHVATALIDGWKSIYAYGTRRQLELDPIELDHTEDLLRDVTDQLTNIYGTEWRGWEEDTLYPRYLSLVMLNIEPSMYEMDWDDIDELTPEEVGTWDDAALGTSALQNFHALLRDVPPVDRENTIDNPTAKYVALGAILRNLGNLESLTVQSLQTVAQEQMIERQRGDLAHFGVVFQTWFSEQSLHNQGIVAERIERLKLTGVADEEPYRTKLKMGKGGVVEETIIERQDENANLEEEGAEDENPVNPTPTPPQGEGSNTPSPTVPPSGRSSLQGEPSPETGKTLWLRSTKFGDDMDRVLRRRDGRLTYIASDVAYHENKLNRPESATKLITILGPDHHGYIGRLTAVMAALLRGSEDTPEANAEALRKAKETLEVVIYQLVRFLKDGKPAPMRKRDGNIYELRDLIDELGKNLVPDGTPDEQRTTGRDVARFFYLMRSHDTTMDFDIDLATQQSDENPVFYAQYAHARICSVLRKAQEGTGDKGQDGEADTSLLVHPRESALIKKILDLPWEVERVAKDYGVHRLTTYAVELARTYHHFYDACRVIQRDQPELTKARLALCQATKTALHATFELLGVSSPERLERREAAA